jgi:hypothetical protein
MIIYFTCVFCLLVVFFICLLLFQDAVLLHLDERQEMERNLLVELSSMSVAKANAELRAICRSSSAYEIQEKLDAISTRRTALRSTPG